MTLLTKLSLSSVYNSGILKFKKKIETTEILSDLDMIAFFHTGKHLRIETQVYYL